MLNVTFVVMKLKNQDKLSLTTPPTHTCAHTKSEYIHSNRLAKRELEIVGTEGEISSNIVFTLHDLFYNGQNLGPRKNNEK